MSLNFDFIFQNIIIFVMIMDPFGNLPYFIATLRDKSHDEFVKIVVRESSIALLIMLASIFLGKGFMSIMKVSNEHLQITGGIVLLIIGLKMIFSSLVPKRKEEIKKDPFIVPLAIPLICGPGLIALLTTIKNSSPFATYPNILCATFIAWFIVTLVLCLGKYLYKIVGNKGIDAMESLMGLLLTCLSISIILKAINAIYGLASHAS